MSSAYELDADDGAVQVPPPYPGAALVTSPDALWFVRALSAGAGAVQVSSPYFEAVRLGRPSDLSVRALDGAIGSFQDGDQRAACDGSHPSAPGPSCASSGEFHELWSGAEAA
jgi:hypothetical protein